MPNDPKLAADTCTYIEAVEGDGGAHSAAGVWWLSPDIKLNGPGGPDKAEPGHLNVIEVFAHTKAGECQMPFATESITVEVWAGNPSLVMAPDNPASAVRIGGLGMPPPSPGTAASVQIDWTPPAGLPPEDPQGSGHKCIVARCFAEPLVPSADDFYVPEDQHVAQRNICVVPCGAPGAAKVPGPCGLDITTVNPSRGGREEVTIRAEFDARPSKHVRNVVLESLGRTPGFTRIAAEPPRAFRFRLPDFPKAEYSGAGRGGCLGMLLGMRGAPVFEARVPMEPAQFTRFNFTADLTGAALGEAHVFHLTHVGEDGRVRGGLTAVMLAV